MVHSQLTNWMNRVQKIRERETEWGDNPPILFTSLFPQVWVSHGAEVGPWLIWSHWFNSKTLGRLMLLAKQCILMSCNSSVSHAGYRWFTPTWSSWNAANSSSSEMELRLEHWGEFGKSHSPNTMAQGVTGKWCSFLDKINPSTQSMTMGEAAVYVLRPAVRCMGEINDRV